MTAPITPLQVGTNTTAEATTLQSDIAKLQLQINGLDPSSAYYGAQLPVMQATLAAKQLRLQQIAPPTASAIIPTQFAFSSQATGPKTGADALVPTGRI